MKAESLRNLGILAHIDAGKTTVSERFLFYTGVERRLGEVHDGTTVMDWMPEERERGITITSAVTTCPWRGCSIQLIDTPGHVDFTAEVARSLRVLDGGIIVLDGVAGPQAQTETVMRQARRRQLPLLLFVNKMDRPGADFLRTVAKAQERLHSGALAMQLPFGEGRELEGVIDLVRMALLTWDEGDQGKSVLEAAIPESHAAAAISARQDLCSRVADLDEAWADHYLEHDDLPADILLEGIRQATLAGELVPVLCGSALRNLGIQPLLDAVVDFLPSPLDRPAPEASLPATGVTTSVPPKPDDPVAAFCFKVTHETHGELVYLRVFSGTLHPGDGLVNVRTGRREKLQTLYTMHADHREKADAVGPGGLLAVTGLPRVQTGDTLCAAERPLLLAPIHFPDPVLKQALEARDSSEHEKLEHALEILVREDPTLRVAEDEDTGGFLLAGMGELHLEIAVHRLEREFKLNVRAGVPRVSFRESIKADVRATASLAVPGDDASQVEVTLSVVLTPDQEAPVLQIPPQCPTLPEDLLHILQNPNLLQGWVGREGYPIAHVQLALEGWTTAGDRAPSQEMLLGAMQLALAKAFAEESVILEPKMALEVQVPEEHLSGVMADLQKRQAQVLEVEAEGEDRKISASVALSRMAAYSTDLRSLTQGMANFQMLPDGLVPHA
ncbi:MAG: elongation factor G [Planctomycetota bacterium]